MHYIPQPVNIEARNRDTEALLLAGRLVRHAESMEGLGILLVEVWASDLRAASDLILNLVTERQRLMQALADAREIADRYQDGGSNGPCSGHAQIYTLASQALKKSGAQ